MALRSFSSVLALLFCASCTAGGAPTGMQEAMVRAHRADPSLLELARVAPTAGERALLVVHPRSACSGSASAVFVDDRGRFLAAVAPGTGTLVSIPEGLRTLRSFSSVEVTASKGTWYAIYDVAVPPLPRGLIVRSVGSARNCGKTGQYAETASASKEELEAELLLAEVRWLESRKVEGQAWLDTHHARVDEILGGEERISSRGELR